MIPSSILGGASPAGINDQSASNHDCDPMTRSHVPAWLAVAAVFPALASAQTRTQPAPVLDWHPGQPSQGQLFMVRVAPPADVRIASIRGEVAGEALHFASTTSGAFESLAPVPVDQRDSLAVSVTVTYEDGRSQTLAATVPVASGAYTHEQLTVAPQFGTQPDSAGQARLARDRARAREVSRQAHLASRLWTDDIVIPRDDRVTSGFGDGREFNGQISSRHMGLDLDGEPGDTVVAVTRGVVALVDDFLLAGSIVYLNHGGGLLSGYFHLSEQLVAEGDTVEAGTPIGRVGATGRVTGPHLHWVVRYGSTSVDPRSLLTVVGGEGR
jgi:murein DD-endopeptidase MepM/ murein hydrolase activator NlpD